MNVPAITILIWFGLVATAAAQGTPTGKGSSQGAPSQAQLSEIRSVVNELEARTEKLHELMEQYREMVGERPQGQEALAKWNTALDRLMRRIDQAHAAVAESTQHLSQVAKGSLPTSLGKDVANAHNEAEAQRTAAEHALAKNKPAKGGTSKPAKQTAAKEKAPPPMPDGLDGLDE
jgi:DNA repair exonuclease SbcCD ATPase subunit